MGFWLPGRADIVLAAPPACASASCSLAKQLAFRIRGSWDIFLFMAGSPRTPSFLLKGQQSLDGEEGVAKGC